MNNIKSKLLIMALLNIPLVANAEIVFDLHTQHFAKAIEGQYEGARYELPKTFVSTNLKYTGGRYLSRDEAGYINVEVKVPVANWSTSVDAFYIMGSSYAKTRTMKWTSENGESILVSFRHNAITFNGSVVYTAGEFKRMTVVLTQNGNDIELVINGTKAATATRETFGKLKYIEVQAIYESDSSDGPDYDYINSITIGSK